MGNKSSSRIPTGPRTRNRVLTNIQSALQSYLGDNYTIMWIKVSNDELGDPERGQMAAVFTGNRVMPDLTATHLVYESTVQIFSRLFLCTGNNSTDTRFLFVWNVRGRNARWQWHIGSPHLSGDAINDSAVQCSTQNITTQVARNSASAIMSSFGNMMPGTPFSNDVFVWTRSSQVDANFGVSKATDRSTLHWRAQETGPAVTLTDNESLVGRYSFRQN